MQEILSENEEKGGRRSSANVQLQVRTRLAKCWGDRVEFLVLSLLQQGSRGGPGKQRAIVFLKGRDDAGGRKEIKR